MHRASSVDPTRSFWQQRPANGEPSSRRDAPREQCVPERRPRPPESGGRRVAHELVDRAWTRLVSMVLEKLDDLPAALMILRVCENSRTGARPWKGHMENVADSCLWSVGHQNQAVRQIQG